MTERLGPGAVAAPPIASHIIDEGHAWIASGYRAREYQPHLFIEDLIALHELFQKEITPRAPPRPGPQPTPIVW